MIKVTVYRLIETYMLYRYSDYKNLRYPLRAVFYTLSLWLLSALLGLMALPTYAQEAEKEPVTVEQLQAEIAEVPVSSKDNADLQVQTSKLSDIQQRAQLLLASVTQQVADLESKLSSISTPASADPEAPAAPVEPSPEEISADAAPETVFIAEQRSALQKERDRLDAIRKQLILIISEAEEKSKLLVAERRQRFTEELSLQVRSVFSPTFWTNWTSAWPADQQRLQRFGKELSTIGQTAWSAEHRVPLLLGLSLAIVVLLFAQRSLKRLLNYSLIHIIPTGRARRSFLAAGTVLNRVMVFGLASWLFLTGLNWHGTINPEFMGFLNRIFYGVVFAAFVFGLGEALLRLDKDSWRLPYLSNEEVHHLKRLPIYLIILSISYQIVLGTVAYAGLSFISEVNSKTLFTIVLCLIALSFFARSFRRQKSTVEKEYTRPIWLIIVFILAWALAVIALIFTLLGYVSFGSFLINQLVWSTLILATFYILWKLADDFYQAFLSQQGRIGKFLIEQYEFSANLLNQLVVVLSLLTKVLLIYGLIKILLIPFGTSITQLFQTSEILNSIVNQNKFAITTSGLISAIAVLFIGFWLIRQFKGWLENKYFPNTSMEKGVQSSISTMSGYLGGVAVIALTLGTLGLSFDKITWVASALSVGIGFGLQSIVQNFISGLILLTERPVKVGDWVIVGPDDGDIKRINIRATEIQLADRSTLIVPNSEFITKAVRNMTLDKSEGRVQIKLPLPISTNPRTVADMILEVFAEHELVIKEMAPFIRLDSIDNGNLMLSATCYVPSPRMVGQVRTELLFEILDRLHKANIPLTTPLSVSHISQTPEAEIQANPAVTGGREPEHTLKT